MNPGEDQSSGLRWLIGRALIPSIASLFVVIVYALRFRILGNGPFLDSQPWVGWKRERFSYLRGVLRCLTEPRSIAAEGYQKFTKLDKTFVFPSVASGPVLMLPNSLLKDILFRLDSEVDGNEALDAAVEIRYSVDDPDIYTNKFHVGVVRKQFTRNLAFITPMVAEEVDLALKDYWGTDAEQRGVEILPIISRIVARVTTRIFYGPELCRNEDFITYTMSYSAAITKGGMIIQIFPSIMRPLLGRLVKAIANFYMRRALKFSVPIIEKRIAEMGKPGSKGRPNDGLQWLLNEAEATSNSAFSRPAALAQRLLFLNTLAIDSTAMATSQAFLDILSAGPEVLQGLKEELDRELNKAGGKWTKTAIDSCIRMDSALHESMRHSSFALINFPRRIVAPSGITMPNGMKVPKNVKLAAPIEGIHHDPRFYDNADEYDAFRFSRDHEGQKLQQEGNNTATKSEEDLPSTTTTSSENKMNTSTTVSDTFLTFGYGRHACPGRFFATSEMKLILAHALLNYDIQPFPKRPEDMIFLEFKIVQVGSQLKVSRRGGSSTSATTTATSTVGDGDLKK